MRNRGDGRISLLRSFLESAVTLSSSPLPGLRGRAGEGAVGVKLGATAHGLKGDLAKRASHNRSRLDFGSRMCGTTTKERCGNNHLNTTAGSSLKTFQMLKTE